MTKTITAKELTVPAEAWERLNTSHAPGTASLADILTDGGHLREKETYGLAILMIKAFKELTQLDALMEKEKHVGPKNFSTVMIGFALSYALGNFDFELQGAVPFAMPGLDTKGLDSSDFVKLRNGAKLETDEQFLPYIIKQFDEAHVSEVFELVYPKARFGGRKEAQSLELCHALMAMMKVVDSLDETRFTKK